MKSCTNWSARVVRASTLLPTLAMMCLLGGCASIRTLIPTAGTDDPALQASAAAIAADMCRRGWRPQTYSSRDAPETQREAQANNAARDAYCRARQ